MPHELITPLNGILGFSEYLNQNSYLSEEEIRMAANSIHSCGQRLNKLIQNYLLFTQLLVEYNTPEKNHLSGNQLPLETIELIEKICWTVDESRKDDLVMDLKPARIKISRNDFTRVIEELVGNALKFSAKGLKINISSKIEQGYYFLKIENFGKGITRQQIDEIGAFVQFNRQKTEQQGLGLGLEIVKLLISLNGGNIKFNSRENEFFKVKIQFPVS
jgi:signal transduction histidine kinase